MNNKSAATTNNPLAIGNIISWLLGIVFFAIGIVNAFWGNDRGFGVFILLLSLVFFPPIDAFMRKWTGFKIPVIGKIILGILILWASLGVGELFDKIDLMMQDL
jgi:hypothetical protein